MNGKNWHIALPAKKRHGDELCSWPRNDRETVLACFRRLHWRNGESITSIFCACYENKSVSRDVAPFILLAASKPFTREERAAVEYRLEDGPFPPRPTEPPKHIPVG